METMDWTKQSQEMFKTWTEAQTRMWNDWLRGMQGFGKSQSSQVWDKTVDAWDESVKKVLDSQVEWARRWSESVTNKGVPKEMTEWAKQGQDMIQRWTETQKQLWASWFQVVKHLDPSSLGVNWGGDGQKFLQNWQEAVQKALDAQTEWARRWQEQAEKKS